ncbi:MAG: hypothetical protein BECKG1743D_GA0114223_108852 [Candidatus Kentron sp. G]|nr:MAG: hypothetical protein BECKG1743D_GA0114223_108852 [Candidatus Kentron sp. G]
MFASLAVIVLGFVLPESYSAASFEEKQEALRVVIHGYTFLTAAVGAFVWFSIPDDYNAGEPGSEARKRRTNNTWEGILHVFRLPSVWLQAIIVLCAYVAYKDPSKNNLNTLCFAKMVAWLKSIIPFTVKRITFDRKFLKFSIRYLDTSLIGIFV